MTAPEDVLAFWLDETKEEDWYRQNDALDEAIRQKFGAAWEDLMQGGHALWLTYPNGALAYIILADQFPRNMFRDDPRAFASDHIARSAAKQAIHRGWDLRIDPPARQFFYLPLMHSENAADQDRCVRLMKTRLTSQPSNLLHARVHREIIRLFGRFPYRNIALGRKSNTEEQNFVENGGYGHVLNAMQLPEPA